MDKKPKLPGKMRFRYFTALAVAVIVIPVLLILGVLYWYLHALQPASSDTTKKQFTITAGETGTQVANNLQQDGLIRSALAFRIYAKKAGISQKFGEGVYYLAPSLDAAGIANQLLHGEADVWITTIEGWRNEEIAQRLQAAMGIDPQVFLTQANEGYMFPDTYLFNKKEKAPDIAATMEANFDKRVTPDVKAQIASQKLTLDQGIIVASIVEREAHDSVPNERQIIASILLKRLRLGMPLQVDATVQYALGYDTFQKKWWRELSVDELQTPSPYNTYLHTGLPPTPICNPGLASIEAVAQATDTPYLYYLHDKNGTVHFAKTLEEHNANKAKYIQ